MAQFHDRPARPEARTPPSHKAKLASAEVRRWLVAKRRLLVAKTAAAAGPRPRDMVDAVKKIHDQLDGWEPTRPTICSLAQMWEMASDEKRRDLSYFLPKHAGGRPRRKLSNGLQAALELDIEETPTLGTSRFIERLDIVAKKYGLGLPGEWVLRQLIEKARGGVLQRSAEVHGRRPAEVDGVPHETLPYTRPYECATEDELVVPIWIGIWSEFFRKWVSTLIYVAFVLDYVSRAVVAWHVCDPRRRRGKKSGQLFSGFDTQDVTAAFLKATRRELAPAILTPYAGFLPDHIRMDGHGTHRAWKDAVEPFIPTEINLLPDYRPYRNGLQEIAGWRLKGQIETLFAGQHGYIGTYIPTDRIRESQQRARVRSAATNARLPRKIEVLPEDLPRIEDLELFILPKIVKRYNEERKHSAHGMTPHDAFMSKRPRSHQLTPSDPLVRALPTKTVTASKGSIQLQQDNVVYMFDHRINGRILPVGESVVAHIHPLMQCIWVVDGPRHALVHVPLLRDASAARDSAYVAEARKEMTGGFSERMQEAQNERAKRSMGEERFRQAQAAAGGKIADEAKPRRAPTPDGSDDTANLSEIIVDGSSTPLSGAEVWLGGIAVENRDDASPPTDGAKTSQKESVSESRPAQGTTATGASPSKGQEPSTRPERVPRKRRNITIPRRRPKPPVSGPPKAPRAPPPQRAAVDIWLRGLAGFAESQDRSSETPPSTGPR